jgi:hypothetical protein
LALVKPDTLTHTLFTYEKRPCPNDATTRTRRNDGCHNNNKYKQQQQQYDRGGTVCCQYNNSSSSNHHQRCSRGRIHQSWCVRFELLLLKYDSICLSVSLFSFLFFDWILFGYCLGLQRWEQARREWLARSRRHNNYNGGGGSSNNSDNDSSSLSTPRAAAVPLDVDDIIEVIFSPHWRGVGVGIGATAATANTTAAAAVDTNSVTTTTSQAAPTVTVETESTSATAILVNNATEQRQQQQDIDDPRVVMPQRFPTNVPLPQMVVS